MANIAVIGAGVAGLTIAFLAKRAGHKVAILEAKPHAGGLSQSVRDGDVVTELDDDGHEIRQTVRLDPGLYVNSGPGRLPHHHRRILGLAHDLGVALEPYMMSSDANYYVDARTKTKYRRRRIEHDVRGYVAELAYADNDRKNLRDLVTAFGDLHDGRYTGTPRAGDGDPVPLGVLARMRFWENRFWQPCTYLWQDSMFQPTNGMDAIWKSLLVHVGDDIIYNAPVHRIRTSNRGAKVWWCQSGEEDDATFDWVASTIPLPHLSDSDRVRLDGFAGDYRNAAATPGFAPACKVGWQSTYPWWQSNTEQIYGGISYSSHAIQQFWYPSAMVGNGPATLTGAYNAYDPAAWFGAKTPRERMRIARKGGAMIHDEVADEDIVPTKNAVTVAWHRVPYQAGGWCDWQPGTHDDAFGIMQRAEGRFVAIGDQVSACPGWQEGCVASAERAMAYISGKQPRMVDEAPDSQWLTMGDHPWGSGTFDE